MDNPSEKINAVLVTGATGHQGGAVAEVLLQKGHRVKTHTRNLHWPAARQLEMLGASLVRGDFDDSDSQVQAMFRVDMVFAMGNTLVGNATLETQIKQNRLLCEIVFPFRVQNNINY